MPYKKHQQKVINQKPHYYKKNGQWFVKYKLPYEQVIDTFYRR